jgi:hypothetical protein
MFLQSLFNFLFLKIISDERLFYDSVTSGFSINSNLKSQGESLLDNELYNTGKTFNNIRNNI